MATQEEWRQIAYQRGLGERGISTSSIHNREAFDTFQRNKQEQERWRKQSYDALIESSKQPSAGANTSPSYRTLRQSSPLEGLIIVSLLPAAGYGIHMQSWYFAAAAFVASASAILLLKLFFATKLGKIVSYLLLLGILISTPIIIGRVFGNAQGFWTAVGASVIALSPRIRVQAEYAGTVIKYTHKLIRILCFSFLVIIALYFVATLAPSFSKA